MKKLIVTLALSLLFLVPATHADPPGPPGPGGDPGGSGGVPVGSPIDGGLSILLAMGLAFGGFKLFNRKQQADTDQGETL
jgi:hypothetical protein